jgi:pimeloyl-ACP methyl ester carboxylesterase
MRLFDWLSSGPTLIGKGVEDSRRAMSWVRQNLRGNRIAPPASWKRKPEQPPVLLIHGYLGTRGSLHVLEERLSSLGHLVFTYRLGALHVGDIAESAAVIARKVESIAAQTSLDRLDIVGYSMGGLVGLYYVKKMGGRRRVRRLVMLGTPASGTWSALWGLAAAPFAKAGLQLLPDSAFLRDLGQAPMPPEVQIVSVAGERDRLAPLHRTILDGGRHIVVNTNHAGLLVDGEIADLVGEILGAPEPPGSTAVSLARTDVDG